MTQYPDLKKRLPKAARPTAWEVRLARMALRICDRFDWNDPIDIQLYNELKPLAEETLRQDDVSRETQSANTSEDDDGVPF